MADMAGYDLVHSISGVDWTPWDPTRPPTPSGNDGGGDQPYSWMNLDSDWIHSLGYNGDALIDAGSGGQGYGTDSYTPNVVVDPQFMQWLNDNNYQLQTSSTTIDDPRAGLNNKQLGRLVDGSGNQIGDATATGYLNEDGFAVGMALMSLFGGAAAAGAAGVEGGLGAANGSWDAVGGLTAEEAASMGGAGAANGSWDVAGGLDGYGGDNWDAFGQMGGGGGGAGSWYEPAVGSSGSSWLKDAYDTVKKGIPGQGGSNASSGGMGPFTGGMSPGDRYRQQLAAQALRDGFAPKEQPFHSVWSGPPQS